MTEGSVWIGTSGWTFDSWSGRFYPKGASKRDWLRYYADAFDAVEINGSFYRLPKRETFASWAETVGRGFRFAVKASRYLTHMKKLKDPEEPLEKLYEASSGLGNKRAATLFQLPPRWRCNPERLARFLSAVPRETRIAVEFRDESWHCQEVLDILNEHGAAFCIYDLEGKPSPWEVTSDFVYLRLHGPGHEAYKGAYGSKALEPWAQFIDEQRSEGREVYCFFDNDEKAFAPKDAQRLRERLS